MGQQQPLPTEDGAAAQGSGAPNALGDYHEVASRGNADDMSKVSVKPHDALQNLTSLPAERAFVLGDV